MAFVACLALDPRPEQRRRPSVDKPIGGHHHDTKQAEACAQAQFMKRASPLPQCRRADRRSRPRFDIGVLEDEYQRKNRII
jgi:hypothetical protein